MGHSTSNALLDGFSRRSLARIVYLAVFVVLYYGTELFVQYPLLQWVGLFGLVVVFFDAVICSRRRWRALRAEMNSENEEPDTAGR
jgi:hypothetical protein